MPNVLIVDDDEDFLVGAVQRLEQLGYDCSTAKSLDEAVQVSASDPPDCYILDIRLETGSPSSDGRDGVELFETLKRTLKGRRAIFMSAYTDYAEDYLMRRGATCLLDKTTFATDVVQALPEAFMPRALLVDDDLLFSATACELL